MIFRDLEQKIIQDLNESGMSIDAVYFIMKSIMNRCSIFYYEKYNGGNWRTIFWIL